jgi:hypothetical protein
MTVVEIWSFIASVTSAILAIIAIGLSIIFFLMSIKSSRETEQAAQNTKSSADRLEKIFDSLYTSTFALMKDTVTEVSRHAWPEGSKTSSDFDLRKTLDEKISLVQKESDMKIENKIQELAKANKLSDQDRDALTNTIRTVMNDAINKTKSVEEGAKNISLRQAIANLLLDFPGHRPVRAGEIVDVLSKSYQFNEIMDELNRYRELAIIAMSTKEIQPNTKILVKDEEKLLSQAINDSSS